MANAAPTTSANAAKPLTKVRFIEILPRVRSVWCDPNSHIRFKSPIPAAPRSTTVGNTPTAGRRLRVAVSKIGDLRNIFRSRNFADKVTLGVWVSIGLRGNFPLFWGTKAGRETARRGEEAAEQQKSGLPKKLAFSRFLLVLQQKTPQKRGGEGEFSSAREIRIRHRRLRPCARRRRWRKIGSR